MKPDIKLALKESDDELKKAARIVAFLEDMTTIYGKDVLQYIATVSLEIKAEIDKDKDKTCDGCFGGIRSMISSEGGFEEP